MRATAMLFAFALALGGCMSRPPTHDRSGEVSYNRRDLPPEQGLLTGPDGVWTIYRNDATRSDADEAPARKRTILGSDGSEPAPSQR